MRYNIKVVKMDAASGIDRGRTFPCDGLENFTVPPGCYAATHDANGELCRDSGLPPMAEPGVTLTLFPNGDQVQLPRDGNAAYLTNETGQTVDSYHWPIRKKNFLAKNPAAPRRRDRMISR